MFSQSRGRGDHKKTVFNELMIRDTINGTRDRDVHQTRRTEQIQSVSGKVNMLFKKKQFNTESNRGVRKISIHMNVKNS